MPDSLHFHGNGGSFPPLGTITASDHGPAVVVATWIMICLMGLSVIARFGTRHTFENDSVVICLACVRTSVSLSLSALPPRSDVWKLIRFVSQVTVICQSITVHLATDYGLGRHRTSIDLVEYAHYSKVQILCLRECLNSGSKLRVYGHH